MRGRPLPRLSPASCRECTRRDVVQGLGVAAAATFLGLGCGADADPLGPDGGVSDGVSGNGTAMCGDDLCLDLTHPANTSLTEIEGARTLSIPGDRLVVVRRSATEFAVLTRVCTHNGCAVNWSPTSMLLVCPCHGSRFNLDGSVALPPADRPLKQYDSRFDEATQVLTIVL